MTQSLHRLTNGYDEPFHQLRMEQERSVNQLHAAIEGRNQTIADLQLEVKRRTLIGEVDREVIAALCQRLDHAEAVIAFQREEILRLMKMVTIEAVNAFQEAS